MSLSDLEKKIVTEGEKVRAAALRGALKLRKANFAVEIAKIEEELAVLEKVDKPASESQPAPEPAPKPAAESPKKPRTKKAEAGNDAPARG